MNFVLLIILFILVTIIISDAQNADELICASCTVINLVRYNSKIKCECSKVDLKLKNHVVCKKFYAQKINCFGLLGFCCDKNNQDTCPVCSTSFTRNADCECESLELTRKVFKKFVTKKEALDAFCCDETKPLNKTTTPPPILLKRIRPPRHFVFKTNFTNDDD
ncbi:hypothetical protein PVAND_013031 [Polypedilum vanderplanki]|uniref:Uncharacterized protein n=1 Tax=Polypedilum vanderplanki TaxID=319348 RepID=A0A9J6CQ82_POLVA|nr:hypothetical protein PVAND_013031 [Polypedilum vanderplanki]